MASYPTSLDSLTNPLATNTLDSPDHATQHATANDILEALEQKVGIGDDTAASGEVLVGTGAGASEWGQYSHATRHLPAGADALTTAAPGSSDFGDSANAGAAESFSKSDHRHGREVNPVTAHAAASDPHTGYLKEADFTTKGDLMVATGASTPERFAASGFNERVLATKSATLSGLDWLEPASPAGADIEIDAAASDGSAYTYARAYHSHKLVTYATAAAAIGTASAGTSTTAPSRGNHVHPTGAGTPSTQAIGDAADTGAGPAAAMTDHKHAITNPLTTQYDLWMGGASGAPGRLAKGSNWQHLITNGSGVVGWASRSGFEGTASGQSIANATDDPIEWTEVTDTDGFHTGTANAIVIPTGMAGWYAINASCEFSSGGTSRKLTIKKGSTIIAWGSDGTTSAQRSVSWIGKLAAADSITIVAYANAAGVTADAQVGLIFLGL